MRISILEENGLYDLKSNLPRIVQNFALQDTGWINEYFGHSPFIDTKYQIDDFSLDMSQEKPFLTEFENVKRIYRNLDFLSDSQASEERLWAGLCLTHFWTYTQYRWNIVNNCSVNNIMQHFFFDGSPRRALTRNAISRLWWIGRLTYDSSRSDPYEITQYVCEQSDHIMHILERNTSNNPKITQAFVTALIDARKEGYSINTDSVGNLSKYLNLLGGTYILDCLPAEQIHMKILTHARTICKIS